MKRILLIMLLSLSVAFAYSQTTYYWVGGAGVSPASITTAANWNTSVDGTGLPRAANLPSTGGTDILVFDGTNTGGTTPTTGMDSVNLNGSISCAQMKFVNNANIVFVRMTSGTSTVIITGSTGEDFMIDAGATLSLSSYTGSNVLWMQTGTTGRVSGDFNMITTLQARICNTNNMAPLPPPVPATLVFTSGSNFRTNITAGSAAYAFGNSSQATQKWVSFEAGSHLYYQGGYSPHGSGTLFSAIDMLPGSVWHHRANNAGASGNFFNRQSYGDIIVENNATLSASGTIYGMGNLTINSGCTFIPATSGQTVVFGNIVANGDITLPATGTNRLVLAGSSAQTISGSGTISVANLSVASNANLTLSKNIGVDVAADIYGKIDFGANQLTGNAAFYAAGVETTVPGTGNLVSGRYFITGNTTYGSSSIGRFISGTGITANTVIVAFSSTSDSMYISQPLTATASGVAITATNNGATLATNNSNGFDPAAGSVIAAGNKVYGDSINYIINAATNSPFGLTTGSSGNMRLIGFAEVNAPITVNSGIKIHEYLTINGKIKLRPLDLLHIADGAYMNGTINSTNYIVTDYNLTGDQSMVRYDGMSSMTLLPIGTVNYYTPVILTPTGASDFTAAVFEGITTTGTITGTPLTTTQKQTVVNAVWIINRVTGSGNADVQLGWDGNLEGSTFTTLPGTDIGLIKNNGSSWDLPVGTGDNTANTVTGTMSSFGAFGAGAVPQVNPFVFNALPAKTYGDADFNGGATSLNTTQPIVYTSSNTNVATIVSGNIHITGAGTTDITATQATDGFYPAASVTQPLTVTKAALTITADNKTKFEGQANPTLTATYTGLVLGETPAALLTPAVLATTAVTASPPGTYPITVSGATSNNYDITFQNGTLTVQAKQNQTITFNALPTKTYGNADFNAGASSTNNTIPITFVSSNTSVATVNSSGVIHITGAGTSTITASQAGNAGYFPAADVARTLTVNKVNLTVRVLDTTKIEGTPNPPFTMTYTGFVLGETPANLTTQPTVNTTATTNSSAGNYVLTPGGGASQNYNFVYVTGRLTILPVTGTDQQALVVFQNTTGNLTVRVYSLEPSLGDIIIFDMNGRPLVKKNIYMPKGFIQTDVPIPTVPSGIYVVAVRGEGVDLRKMVQIFK
jgi:hypothetical protein